MRVRATGAAVVVLAVVLLIGASVSLRYARETIALDYATSSAQQQVDRIAERLAGGETIGSLIEELDESDLTDSLIQVSTQNGTVIGASEELEDEGPITSKTWPAQLTLNIDDEPTDFLAVTQTIGETQRQRNQMGPPVEEQRKSNKDLRVVLLYSLEESQLPYQILVLIYGVGIPGILLVVGFTTWWLTGRAMRPVDQMRREVDDITAANLDRRIAHPGGRDEIAKLATTMNGMLDRLQSAQIAQRRFISDASHELRSPLASIRQNAEVAVTYPGTIGEEKLAQFTLEETLRMQSLVESLLTLTRSDELRLNVPQTPVDLDDLLLSEASRVKSSTDLTVSAGGISATRVNGSEGMLAQVIRNLVDNAVRHAHSAISLSSGIQGEWAWISIDDDGTGIPAEDREKVFERFVRLDEARSRDAGGSGLGLSIVSEIVRAHGGVVRAEESFLGGARMLAFLPVASDTEPIETAS